MLNLKPMLAVKKEEAFSDRDWLFEIKWDGYRIIAHKKEKEVQLRSRNLQNYTSKFSSITAALKRSNKQFIIDGEVVVLNEKGKPDFEALQNFRKINPGRLIYFVFDLLEYEGESLLDKPLEERKQLLKNMLPDHRQIKYTDHVVGEGEALFTFIEEQDMEGIVAKERKSVYIPGARSRSWYKIAREQIEDFVVGGYQLREKEDKLKSIIFGAYDEDKILHYIGHTGGGISDKERVEFVTVFAEKEINKCPFFTKKDIPIDKRTRWIKPEIVIKAKYHDFTSKIHIRKPAIFKGFRDDKDPEDVVLPQLSKKAAPSFKEELKSNWPYVDKERSIDPEQLTVDGQVIQLWNLKKVLWKEENITKGDLLLYYSKIADYILPYLNDRPESLHIKYKGPMKSGVYIKDMEGKAPEWVSTWKINRKIARSDKRDVVEYLLVQDKASLLYMINLGCIDCNPWLSTIMSEDFPTYAVIDIDPTGSPFHEVVQTALVVKNILDKNGLPGVPKTSGKTGLHIYIPLMEKYTFAEAEALCKTIAVQAHKEAPSLITTDRMVEKRGRKVYIDWMQNKKQQTIAAPYSVRPFPGATVSTPLQWDELNNDLNPNDFTLKTMPERLQKVGDLFEPLLAY